MSQAYRHQEIKRCPLCFYAMSPAHVGHGVMVCEGCGGQFRVVKAFNGTTGKKLGDWAEKNIKWGEPAKPKHAPLKRYKGSEAARPLTIL